MLSGKHRLRRGRFRAEFSGRVGEGCLNENVRAAFVNYCRLDIDDALSDGPKKVGADVGGGKPFAVGEDGHCCHAQHFVRDRGDVTAEDCTLRLNEVGVNSPRAPDATGFPSIDAGQAENFRMRRSWRGARDDVIESGVPIGHSGDDITSGPDRRKPRPLEQSLVLSVGVLQ